MAKRAEIITSCDYCGATTDDVAEHSNRTDARIARVVDACEACWSTKAAEIDAIMAPGRSKTAADREAAKIKKLLSSLGPGVTRG